MAGEAAGGGAWTVGEGGEGGGVAPARSATRTGTVNGDSNITLTGTGGNSGVLIDYVEFSVSGSGAGRKYGRVASTL